jgi:choline dehydrogenase-like flavoprotein
MSHQPDPIREGLARGWPVHGSGHAPLPSSHSCDVVIVGSGAGAGITAEMLTKAGLDVLIVEEGPLMSSTDFRQRESDAYPNLYQESAARKTADKAINVLQGRCVGGSTTVNWTSSFRTPPTTLAYWQQQFGLKDFGVEAMAPWFEAAERRLNIHPWEVEPNRNNALLSQGAAQLGIEAKVIPRNVKGCWNLGSCGMGCPTNAKQSMLVTTIPASLDHGAKLWVRTRAQAYDIANGRVQGLVCQPLDELGHPKGGTVRVTAKHYVLSGGSINSPALLLRSQAPDPHERLGRRTFLHPVVLSASLHDQPVQGWAGAPQSVYTDHFLHTQPVDGPIGYKLEAPPLHPVIFSSSMIGFGVDQAERLKQFPNTQVLLALLRDGFHAEAPGGRVTLRSDGSPLLDYPLTEFVMEGARRALLSMAELQFAGGAREVLPVHEMAKGYKSWNEAKSAIQALPMKPLLTRVVSAHVMGGCAIAGDEHQGVVRPDGVHWQIENLSVHDGSLFPTSIGANPQLSIYGLVSRLTAGLAKRLTGREVQLA